MSESHVDKLLDKTIRLDQLRVMQTYRRAPIVFVRGQGAVLYDSDGREYIDFLGGIAVTPVGHCHPHVTAAIHRQAGRLVHVSNLFHNELQAQLAAELCRLTGMERAFFCNSGAEAVETALKLARKWGKSRFGAECSQLVTFEGSFHGRTFGALSATAQPKYQAPFEPIVPGFAYAPFGDLESARSLIGEATCGVLVEPVQGESGVHPAESAFMRGLREACNESDALLMCDEIQCGMGRSGRFLASQWTEANPDVITLAKGLASGLPIGVCLARGGAADVLTAGDHGSTFGGQPLACAAALATLEVLANEGMVENAAARGLQLMTEVMELAERQPDRIAGIRGKGLMLAIELAQPDAQSLGRLLLRRGVVVNAIGDRTLRLLPPLCISREQVAQFASSLALALGDAPSTEVAA
ncbi:MAG: aspartate aminotransferase family protein [Armatimonadetes bacterium]|nr:aspartate aminotransferase family protein [Armatimonadota bacterium]MDE2206961.1 aspartate aminotransferase family protein [Armatimonadota bacterium]